jgi:peptidoglycan/LPS O-acetylase OafA/YrhL
VYFTFVSIIGLYVARNFDTDYGYRKDMMESLFISFAFGVASIIACFGLKKRKPWSTGMIMAMSAINIIYVAKFFSNNTLKSSGSCFVLLLLLVSVFSIAAMWKRIDAQKEGSVDKTHTP